MHLSQLRKNDGFLYCVAEPLLSAASQLPLCRVIDWTNTALDAYIVYACFQPDHYQSTETWTPPVVSQMTEPVSNTNKSGVTEWSLLMTNPSLCGMNHSLFPPALWSHCSSSYLPERELTGRRRRRRCVLIPPEEAYVDRPGDEPLPGSKWRFFAVRWLPGHAGWPGHKRWRHRHSRWNRLTRVHHEWQWPGVGRLADP